MPFFLTERAQAGLASGEHTRPRVSDGGPCRIHGGAVIAGRVDKAAAFSQHLDDEVQLWFKTLPESTLISQFPHSLDVLFNLSGMMS